MTERVVVTVKRAGEARVRDLELRADLPARELAADVAEALGWSPDSLGRPVSYDIAVYPTGGPLPPRKTLAQVNVGHGSWLLFHLGDPPGPDDWARLVGAPKPAEASEELAAREAMQKADSLLEAGQGRRAYEALAEAHRIAPHLAAAHAAELLSRGRIREKAGNPTIALSYYRAAARVSEGAPLAGEVTRTIAAVERRQAATVGRWRRHARWAVAPATVAVLGLGWAGARFVSRGSSTARASELVAEARSLWAKGDRNGAVARTGEAIGLAPDDPAANAWLAEMGLQLGDVSQARVGADRALAADSNYAPARRVLAAVLLGAGDPDGAVREAQRAIALTADPAERARAHTVLGTAYSQQRQYGRAVSELEQAVRLAPREVEAVARLRLGQVLSASGRSAEAVPHLRAAVQLDPASPSAYESLGSALHAGAQHAAAEEAYRRAVELEPANAGARRGLAETLDARGKSAPAAQEYAEYLRIDPRAPDREAVEKRVATLRGAGRGDLRPPVPASRDAAAAPSARVSGPAPSRVTSVDVGGVWTFSETLLGTRTPSRCRATGDLTLAQNDAVLTGTYEQDRRECDGGLRRISVVRLRGRVASRGFDFQLSVADTSCVYSSSGLSGHAANVTGVVRCTANGAPVYDGSWQAARK